MEPAAATPCPTPFSPYEPCAPIAPATLAFVLCIEATAIEAQALRLCQSIRAHCGAYATAPIYAICPRPRHAPSPRTRARLTELQVVYVEEDLNQTGSPYLPINRIVAASWAERNIARLYREVTAGKFENETCQRAVDGVLTCVLGYEAAARRTRLTMDALLKENKRLEVDLRGLKT